MKEEDTETTLLKFVPASGEYPSRWLIRGGNCICLGELFLFGKNVCSCWDMYRTHKSLEIFIHRRAHLRSDSDQGILRQNAKKLRHQETGYWSLPRR